ncbi:MAG: phospho-N-acetylmuramoyl-pentapeptide-transferase [Spirochaetaceae bacterium]|nr:phospho-N-acetylmuramoyl-pentapeptide-transferase [Spirochaetaceae bacterium]
MFKWLLLPLVEHQSFFNIFQYITFRTAYSIITALLISFIAGPAVIKWLHRIKFGQSIRSDGPASHLSKQGTPTMGGALMILSVVVSTLLWQDLTSFYTWLFIIALLAFGTLGFIDDYLKIKKANSDGISSKVKSLGQITISLIIVLVLMWHNGFFAGNSFQSLLFVPILKEAVANLHYLYIPFAVFIMVGVSNATNLTDGLDGLLTGLLLFAFATFALIAYVSGHAIFAGYLLIPFIPGASELAIPIAAVCGACLGFLWYNGHKAEVFMGDTGSLAFGGVLGLLAIMLKKELLLIIIGGVFVLETLSVIIQTVYFKYTKKRYGEGKRVFKMAPLHHHYEKLGWSETKIVTRFWIIGIMFTLIALSTLKIN